MPGSGRTWVEVSPSCRRQAGNAMVGCIYIPGIPAGAAEPVLVSGCCRTAITQGRQNQGGLWGDSCESRLIKVGEWLMDGRDAGWGHPAYSEWVCRVEHAGWAQSRLN